MEWVFKNIIQLATILFVIVSIVRALKQSREAKDRHEDETIESEEQRRVREIQERIRRAVAERRGEQPPVSPPVLRSDEAAAPTFHRRHAEPAALPPHVQHTRNAELERQERLAEEMRALEEAKHVAARRAVHRATEKAEAARSEASLRAVAHGRLLEDLRDPQSVRRAFVLREVLGPPVGLR